LMQKSDSLREHSWKKRSREKKKKRDLWFSGFAHSAASRSTRKIRKGYQETKRQKKTR